MQAMIITAYRDEEALLRMVQALSCHALCYVHVDRKGTVTDETAQKLNALPGVYAVKRYAVNWGSIHHLYALLDLMQEALKDARVTHLHLISAQDFPVISHQAFEAFFEGNDRVYMQRLRTADYPELAHRYEHYHLMHRLNYRDMSERVQNLVGRMDRWQDALHVRRKLQLPYKGLVWCSLPRDAAEYAVNHQDAKRLLKKLRYTYIPEEFFFQNVFASEPWCSRVTEDAKRFSIWDAPQRGLPALLDEDDLPAIDASGCLFCRKVQGDSPLYHALEKRWLNE